MKLEGLNLQTFADADRMAPVDCTVRNLILDYVRNRLRISERIYDPHHKEPDIEILSLEAVGTVTFEHPAGSVIPLVLIKATGSLNEIGQPQPEEDSEKKSFYAAIDNNGLLYHCPNQHAIQRYSSPFWIQPRAVGSQQAIVSLIARDLLGQDNLTIKNSAPVSKEELAEAQRTNYEDLAFAYEIPPEELERHQQHALLPLKGTISYANRSRRAKIAMAAPFIPADESDSSMLITNPAIVDFLNAIHAHSHAARLVPPPPPAPTEENQSAERQETRQWFDAQRFFATHEIVANQSALGTTIVNNWGLALKEMYPRYKNRLRMDFVGWGEENEVKLFYIAFQSGQKTYESAAYLCEIGTTPNDAKKYLMTLRGILYPVTMTGEGRVTTVASLSVPYLTEKGPVCRILFRTDEIPENERILAYNIPAYGQRIKTREGDHYTASLFTPFVRESNGQYSVSSVITDNEALYQLFSAEPAKRGNLLSRAARYLSPRGQWPKVNIR